MASIGRDPNGLRRILFVAPDGKRKTIRLGKVPQKAAEGVKTKVECLVASALTGQAIDDETSRWVRNLDAMLADKLAAVGLIPKRQRATLQAFIDQYAESRTDVKARTKLKYDAARTKLLAFFGPNKNLRDITPGDADDWRRGLVDKGLAENTVRKNTAIARQFFCAAKRKRLIDENPFAGLKAASQANPARYYFITREEAQLVLDACPDSQWRLLFVLSRFGGLRCPSEHLGLRWGDVDWERGRITVHSPKTEHHEGGASRQIPLFPEIRGPLEEVWDMAMPGEEWVITRYRNDNANLRTQLHRIIRKAGLEPWPKLFQNLRSTRETELVEQYPIQVACEWIGNSQAVAKKHYLQTTDEHFRQAIETPTSAAQKAAQQPSEIGRKHPQQETQNPGFSGDCEGLRYYTNVQVGPVGVEPTTKGL